MRFRNIGTTGGARNGATLCSRCRLRTRSCALVLYLLRVDTWMLKHFKRQDMIERLCLSRSQSSAQVELSRTKRQPSFARVDIGKLRSNGTSTPRQVLGLKVFCVLWHVGRTLCFAVAVVEFRVLLLFVLHSRGQSSNSVDSTNFLHIWPSRARSFTGLCARMKPIH